jgi:hypothetical protein
VKSFQAEGFTVGMCGDGANDAPALRQVQIGIAVSTATDVAKSAAGIVLTGAGLAFIVAAVREGRVTFQRTEHAGAKQIRVRRYCRGFSDAHPPCQRDTNNTAPDHYHHYLEHRRPTVPVLQEKVYRRNFTLE